ncbi:UNVERIFIED_CONTAM: hypothetical protein FKN15_043181 [Acipenser sinensis]
MNAGNVAIAVGACDRDRMMLGARSPSRPPRHSKRKHQQDPFPVQLFFKDWPLARLVKTLFEKEIQIPSVSDRTTLFLLLCDSVSARPIFSTRCPTPARSVAASTAHVTSPEPPASIAETQQLPAAEDTMAELHQKIMNDMKQFMQPFANALSAINSRLDGIDNRSTTDAVPPSTSHVPISTPISTTSSVSAAPLLTSAQSVSTPPLVPPSISVPEYNLATASTSGSQSAAAIRCHALSPLICRQIIEGKDINLIIILITASEFIDHRVVNCRDLSVTVL